MAEAQERERKRLAREEQLRNELENTKKQLQEQEQLKQQLARNGWDISTLLQTNAQTAQMRDPYVSEIEKELNETKKTLMMIKEEMSSKEQLSEIVDFVQKSDDYELVRALKCEKHVLDLIKHHYNEHKKLLSYDEAASTIEKHLEKLEKDRSQLLKGTKKAKEWYKFDVDDVKVKSTLGTDEPDVKKATKEPKKTVTKDAIEPLRTTKKLSQNELIKRLTERFQNAQ